MAIFFPDREGIAPRQLTAIQEQASHLAYPNKEGKIEKAINKEDRFLQSAPTPPPAVSLQCSPGQIEWKVSWDANSFIENAPEQEVTLSNGMKATVRNYDTGQSSTGEYRIVGIPGGFSVKFLTNTVITESKIISPGGEPQEYPQDFGTMEIEFPEEIDGGESSRPPCALPASCAHTCLALLPNSVSPMMCVLLMLIHCVLACFSSVNLCR